MFEFFICNVCVGEYSAFVIKTNVAWGWYKHMKTGHKVDKQQRRFLHCINSSVVFLSQRPSTSVDYRSEIFLVWSIASTRGEGKSYRGYNLHRSQSRTIVPISINIEFIIESRISTDWNYEQMFSIDCHFLWKKYNDLILLKATHETVDQKWKKEKLYWRKFWYNLQLK